MYIIGRIKLSPFLKDIASTTATSVVTIVSLVLSTRFLAQGLGPEEFGAYSLARRVLAALVPFSTLIMGVALTRYISLSQSDYARYGYLVSGFLLATISTLIIVLVSSLGSQYLVALIFHHDKYSSLFFATLFMLPGYTCFTVLYAFYRGQGAMGKANLWQLGLMGVGSLLIAWGYSRSGRADLIVLLLGGLLMVTVIPLAYHGLIAVRQLVRGGNLDIRSKMQQLLRYALPRTPGGLALGGILTMGPFLAPYFGTMKEAGYLIVSQSILRIIMPGIAAFGLVVLPKTTQLFSEGREDILEDRISDILIFVFHIGLFTTLHITVWSDKIILIWLGPQYQEALPLMRVSLIATAPYIAYVMLRSIIDSVDEKAVNTRNILSSFVVGLLVSVLLAGSGFGSIGLSIGTTVGLSLLGGSTVYYLYNSFHINYSGFQIKECLMLNAILAIIAYSSKYWLGRQLNGTVLITIVGCIESGLFFLYYLILRMLNVGWTNELEKRIVSRAVP